MRAAHGRHVHSTKPGRRSRPARPVPLSGTPGAGRGKQDPTQLKEVTITGKKDYAEVRTDKTVLNVEQNILRRERLQAIKKHVMALPEKQRTAVLMHKYQGMDYREIAEVLKLSESATTSLLFRAYEVLRERLKEFV